MKSRKRCLRAALFVFLARAIPKEFIGPNRREVERAPLTSRAFFVMDEKMDEKNDTQGEQQQPAELIELQAVAEPSNKRRGEAAEAEFIARASTFGFTPLKPWGECNRYDVAIDHGSGFWRVQVKLTSYSCQSRYHLLLAIRGVTYTPDEIDFVAGYIAPLNLWYIIPIEIVASQTVVSLHPHTRRGSKYNKYREAWCLLDCPRQARGWEDIPAVCRCPELSVRCAVCPLRE